MKKKITVILVSAVIVIAIVSVVLSLPKKPYKDLTADRGKGCLSQEGLVLLTF